MAWSLDYKRQYQREWMRKWRANHPERVRSLSKLNYAKQKEKPGFLEQHAALARQRAAEQPEKIKEIAIRTYIKHRKRWLEYAARYRAEHVDMLKAYFANHYRENADRIKKRISEYRRADPERDKIIGHNKRARKRANGGKLSPNIVALLMCEQNGKCAYCLIDLRETTTHLDHVVPIKLGGTNTDDNMQLTCQTCNCRKNAKHPSAFLAEFMRPILEART